MVRFTVDNRNRLVYYGNLVGFVQDDKAVVDTMFQSDELTGYLARLKLTPEWSDGVFDRLADGAVPSESEAVQLKNCRVWQLKRSADVSMRFIEYKEMVEKFGEPNRANYEPVFDGNLDTNDLEEIYTRCNTQHPPDYRGHSMSMSDVVELYDTSGSEFYYCDRVGFRPIRFEDQEQTQCEEMTM